MPLPPPAEQHTPPSDLENTLHDAAQVRGILLDPERAEYLVKAAEYLQSYDDRPQLRPGFYDTVNDIEVGRTEFSVEFGAAAVVDFQPTLEGEDEEVSIATSAMPEHATIFSLMALHGLQNYVLLVDAGVIEKPDKLHGTTNAEMAIVAERVGLLSDAALRNPGNPALAHKEMRRMKDIDVSGNFNEVSKRLFAPDTLKLEQMLTRRLSAQKRAGTAALSTSAS